MINTCFWVLIGAISGWIGYLLTRTDKSGPVRTYVSIGVMSGLVGGLLTCILGISETDSGIETFSLYSALVVSGVIVTVFAVFLILYRSTSSS